MSRALFLAVASCVLLLALPLKAQGLTYHTSDLAGTWYRHSLSSNKSPEWSRGRMTADASGHCTGTSMDSNGYTGTVDVFLTVLGNGAVKDQGSTSTSHHFFLSPSKDLLAGVEIDDKSEAGLTICVKQGSGFTTSDLAGTWKVFRLEVGHHQRWGYATMILSPSGSFTWSAIRSDGGTESDPGRFSLSSEGVVTLLGDPEFKGQLNLGKNIIVATDGDSDDLSMGILIKQTSTTFTQSDLMGDWVNYRLATGNWKGWERQYLSLGPTQTEFIITNSDGETESGTTGPFSISSSGVLSIEGVPLQALMSSDKLFIGNVESENGSPSLFFTLKRGQTNYRTIRGTVTYDGSPVNAMVLANGQYMFTPADSGVYELVVPLDHQGRITPQIFCSGKAPYRQTFTPAAEVVTHDVAMVQEERPAMDVTINASTTSATRARVHGSVFSSGQPVNAMVLVNGQYMFTSQNTGAYDLDVPLDAQGKITVQVYCAGKAPFRQTLTP